jgi:hypothetical protein
MIAFSLHTREVVVTIVKRAPRSLLAVLRAIERERERGRERGSEREREREQCVRNSHITSEQS